MKSSGQEFTLLAMYGPAFETEVISKVWARDLQQTMHGEIAKALGRYMNDRNGNSMIQAKIKCRLSGRREESRTVIDCGLLIPVLF